MWAAHVMLRNGQNGVVTSEAEKTIASEGLETGRGHTEAQGCRYGSHSSGLWVHRCVHFVDTDAAVFCCSIL